MIDRKRFALAIVGVILCQIPLISQRIIDEIAVVVNNDIILRSDIEARLGLVAADLRSQGIQDAQLEEALAERRPLLVRDLVDELLLLQKAEEYGVDATVPVLQQKEALREEYGFETMEALDAAIVAQGDSVQEFEDAMATQWLTQQVLQQDVDFQLTITTEELRAHYEANLERYDRPEGIAIQEIVFGKAGRDLDGVRQTAEEVLARARDGEDFQMLAFEESEAPTAREGGSIGYMERGALREEYETVAYALSRNQVSELIDLPDAFAIIKLVERHEGGLLPFGLARNQIAFEIQEERAPAARREYLSDLRQEGFIRLEDGYFDLGAEDIRAEDDKDAEP